MDPIIHPVVQTEEAQVDCFTHDASVSLKYLLVLNGSAMSLEDDGSASTSVLTAGAISCCTKEFRYLAVKEPHLLPGRFGPVIVFLVL